MKIVEKLLTDYHPIAGRQKFYEALDCLKEFIDQEMIEQLDGNCLLSKLGPETPTPAVVKIELQTLPTGTRYLLICDIRNGYQGFLERVSGMDDRSCE